MLVCRRCMRIILDGQQKLTSFGRKARFQCQRLTRNSSSTKDAPDVQAGCVFSACRVAKREQNVSRRAICGSYDHKTPGKSTKNGADCEARTHNLPITSRVRYQLRQVGLGR